MNDTAGSRQSRIVTTGAGKHFGSLEVFRDLDLEVG